jgi:cell division protein FtsA
MVELYQSQRAMRQLRRAAMQRGIVAVLDIGTSKIACLVLRFSGPDHLRGGDGVGSLAGQAAFRVIGAATTRSRGIRFGDIESVQEAERAIRTVISAAQKMAAVPVHHVIAGFSGARPRSYGLDGQVDIAGRAVDDGDVGRVLAACEVPDYGDGREVLHAQPVNFALDHRSGLPDPRGQIGQRLSTDLHLLTVDAATVETLMHVCKRCDLELSGIAHSSYVAGLSALVEDEKELGAACIDIGGGATGISVFMRQHMIYADSVRLGGDHVTSDIAMGLQTPAANAERIKTLHGGVVATGMDDREMIPLGGTSGDWDKDARQVSRAELIGIMRPRVEEILEEVRARLDAAGFDDMPAQSIVLTGGCSQIPGIDGLAARILGPNLRLGRPLRVQGLPQAATGPAFAGAVGLSLFAANPQDEWWDFDIPTARHSPWSLKRAVSWVRANW